MQKCLRLSAVCITLRQGTYMLKHKLFATVLLLFSVGCQYNHEKGKRAQTDNPTALADAEVDFKIVYEQVIGPRCTKCHSDAGGNKGRINLETYQNVFENKDAVRDEVAGLTMPPRKAGPLTDAQVKMLVDWIDAGALENANVNPTEPVSGTPSVSSTPAVSGSLPLPTPTPILPAPVDEYTLEQILKMSASKTVTTYPALVVTEENLTIFKVDENREAALYESFSKPINLNVKLELAENLCQPEYVKPICNYNMDIAFDHIAMRWIKHPDATKIGQIVKGKNTAGSVFFEIELQESYGQVDQFIGRKNDNRFKNDEILCDQYDWLDSEIKNNALSKVRLASWNAESMSLNQETGINENRTGATFENSDWLFENGRLKLKNISRIVSENSFLKVLVLGQSSTVQYVNKQNQNCQFSLSHSIQSAIAGINVDQNYKKDPRFVIYKNINSQSYQYLKNNYNHYFSAPAGSMEFE